jgi:hypothetical protein
MMASIHVVLDGVEKDGKYSCEHIFFQPPTPRTEEREGDCMHISSQFHVLSLSRCSSEIYTTFELELHVRQA